MTLPEGTLTLAELRALTSKKQGKPRRTEADLRALFLARLKLLWPEHPTFEEQFHYASPRTFRADFAHVESRLLIELDGGVTGGTDASGKPIPGRAHGSITGILSDMNRSRIAAAHGWRVWRVCRIDLEKDPAGAIETLRLACQWRAETSP